MPRAQITDAQKRERERVITFFARLKTDLGMSGLTQDVFAELTIEMNRVFGDDRFKPQDLRALQSATPKANQDFFDAVKLAIPSVQRWRHHPHVAELYKELFDLEFADLAPDRAVFNFQRDDKTPLRADSPIFGDYLLYRAEQVTSKKQTHWISRSFLRFYLHRNGYIRSMGLWLDDKHEYLSSKGWVVNPDNYFLVVGHIVDRVGRDIGSIRRGAGATMMTIRSTNPNRFTVSNPEEGVPRIQIAPVQHFRATNSTDPSYSCGVLVRLRGVEDEGGDAETEKAERYKMIKRLQKKLSKKLSQSLTPNQAADQLAKASNMRKTVFYNRSGANGLPSGLLVNSPSLSIDDRHEGEMPVLTFGASEHGLPDANRGVTGRDRTEVGLHFDEIDR